VAGSSSSISVLRMVCSDGNGDGFVGGSQLADAAAALMLLVVVVVVAAGGSSSWALLLAGRRANAELLATLQLQQQQHADRCAVTSVGIILLLAAHGCVLSPLCQFTLGPWRDFLEEWV